jgi:flagellar basal body-associated protein FliL
MADDAKENKQDKKPEAKAEAGAQTDKGASAKGNGMILWLILTIVIVVGGGGGFAVSLFMGGSGSADPNAVEARPVAHKPEKAAKAGGHGGGHGGGEEKAGPIHDPDKPWMYDKLDPMVANLDEPGVTLCTRIHHPGNQPRWISSKAKYFSRRRKVCCRTG